MRLDCCDIYPELSDVKYVRVNRDGREGPLLTLGIALLGRTESLPTLPEWYNFATFCRENDMETDEAGRLRVGLEVRYGDAVAEVNDATTWLYMLVELNGTLTARRARDKAYEPPTLFLRELASQPPPGGTDGPPPDYQDIGALGEFQLRRESWIAYEWGDSRSQATGLDAVAEDDEWAACCEFMLHPYGRRAANDGKVLLGTTSAAVPADMLGAYRFLSRVAAGQGGTAVQTIGQAGTLRIQMVIACILRLVVLNRRHYCLNREQHRPRGGGEPAPATCGAGDPFGIQCVCRPGTIAHRLADVVGGTRRPFVFLVKGDSVDRCYEAMGQFFLPRLRSPLRCPMLRALKCENAQGLSVPFRTLWDSTGLENDQFIILLDRARVADALVPPQANRPDANSWLWRHCRSLCTFVFDWQFPRPGDDAGRVAAKAVIKWARRMRFATPGGMGLVSITTPGEVCHGDNTGHRRHLLDAIAPLNVNDAGTREGVAGLTAGLLRRLGFIHPYIPDVSLRAGPAESLRVPSASSPAVTFEHMLLLQVRPIRIMELLLAGPQLPRLQQNPEVVGAELALKSALLGGRAPGNLTADIYATLDGAFARGMNMTELLQSVPATTNPLPTAELERVMDRSPLIQLLLSVVVDGAGSSGGSILVLANDETMAGNITAYINAKKPAGVHAAIMLPFDWLSTEVIATTHLEAEIRMYLTPDGVDDKVVIVAGPDAMNSSWLSLHYIDYCVIFGAPLSPLPLRSLVQALCGNEGGPRDVRIVHIGLAWALGQPLNGLMRLVCMGQPIPGLGING